MFERYLHFEQSKRGYKVVYRHIVIGCIHCSSDQPYANFVLASVPSEFINPAFKKWAMTQEENLTLTQVKAKIHSLLK